MASCWVTFAHCHRKQARVQHAASVLPDVQHLLVWPKLRTSLDRESFTLSGFAFDSKSKWKNENTRRDADLRSKPPAQDEEVAAEDEDAAHTELNWRIVGHQQRSRHSWHAERRQGKRAQRQVFAAARRLVDLCGPDVQGQETSEKLKTKHQVLSKRRNPVTLMMSCWCSDPAALSWMDSVKLGSQLP